MKTLALLAFLAGGDPPYETIALEVGPRVDQLTARDLNGDGRADLLVQCGRDLHVFLFDPARGFAPRAGQTLRLDRSVFLWTLAALDDPSRPLLLTSGSRALQAHAIDNGAIAGAGADLAVHPSLFEGPSSETKPPLFIDFAPDLDRDGRPEILLFQKDRLFVMKRHADGDYRCLQKLPVPVDVATLLHFGPHQKLTEVASVPLLAFADADGDGRPDLSYYRDESLGVFRQDASGRFGAVETLDLAAEKRKRRDRFLKFEVPPRVGDFNADGLLDVALIYPSKGRVQVTYGRPGRRDFTQPDDLMRVADGWSTGIYLEDLNGDRKLDLIMGVVRKFGISEGIQVFLSGKVDLELHIYPMQDSGRFVKDPVQELRFSIPFSFHVTRESASLDLSFRPDFRGDFNRDGLRDLLVAADARTLDIYPGIQGRAISDRPQGSISMSPPEGTAYTEPFVADFNGDGVSDLVLKHILVDAQKHVLELKLSKP
jgi:hypothetical protein